MENGNSENDRTRRRNIEIQKKVRISEVGQSGGHNKVTEESMETTFQQTILIKRGPGANEEAQTGQIQKQHIRSGR